MMKFNALHPSLKPMRQQCGVYALEWAIIFPVFFILLYAIISYGLTFLVRESMQFATEEAARAALQYPSSTIIGNAPRATLEHRKIQAQQTAVNALDWLPSELKPSLNDIQFTVCPLGDATCSALSPLNPNLRCSPEAPCLVWVRFQIEDYRSHAIAPSIPGLGLLLPQSLEARASMLIDRGVL